MRSTSRHPPSPERTDSGSGPVFGEREGQRTRLDESAERKLRAIVQVLAAYGLLDGLTDQQQERLLAGMRRILEASGQ